MSTPIDSVSSYQQLQSAPTTYGSSDLGQDAFLKLLVTQLQNQDPLSPQANEEFVAQLAQFSSLEQLNNANSALGSMYLAMSSMNNASMTQLLGMEVRATGDTFHYGGDGEVELHYEASASTTATLTITDSDGKVVYTEDLGQLSAGEGTITWDGQGISGDLPEGDYTYSIVSTAENAEDVEITTYIEGRIDGMSYETGSPVPSIQGVPIELGDIIEVRSPDEEDDE